MEITRQQEELYPECSVKTSRAEGFFFWSGFCASCSGITVLLGYLPALSCFSWLPYWVILAQQDHISPNAPQASLTYSPLTAWCSMGDLCLKRPPLEAAAYKKQSRISETRENRYKEALLWRPVRRESQSRECSSEPWARPKHSPSPVMAAAAGTEICFSPCL